MSLAHKLKKKDPKVATSFAYATFKVGVLTNSMQMIEESIGMIKALANKHPNCGIVFATFGHVSVCVGSGGDSAQERDRFLFWGYFEGDFLYTQHTLWGRFLRDMLRGFICTGDILRGIYLSLGYSLG